MGKVIHIHPQNPQPRLVSQVVEVIRQGGVVIYPTDSSYALGCHIGDKHALSQIRQIRHLDEKHNFTLICRDLSELSHYAIVENSSFRFLKAYTPGPFTFLLRATREVPRRLQHPRRKTIGLRVPDHLILQAILAELKEPMMSTSLIMPGDKLPLNQVDEIADLLDKRVDLIVDGGSGDYEITTVIDLVEGQPKLIRQGKGIITYLH